MLPDSICYICYRLPPYFSEYVETEDEDIFVITELQKLNVSEKRAKT